MNNVVYDKYKMKSWFYLSKETTRTIACIYRNLDAYFIIDKMIKSF